MVTETMPGLDRSPQRRMNRRRRKRRTRWATGVTRARPDEPLAACGGAAQPLELRGEEKCAERDETCGRPGEKCGRGLRGAAQPGAAEETVEWSS